MFSMALELADRRQIHRRDKWHVCPNDDVYIFSYELLVQVSKLDSKSFEKIIEAIYALD